MKLAFILLLASMAAIQADEIQTLKTIHGPVNWQGTESKRSSEHAGYVILQGVPTTDELQKMDAYADQVASLLAEYVPEALQSPDTLKNLDLALAGWQHSKNTNRESADYVNRIIGSALGRYCITHLKARWAVVSTEFGMDVALVKDSPHLNSPASFVWIFPFSALKSPSGDKKSEPVSDFYTSFKAAIDKNETH